MKRLISTFVFCIITVAICLAQTTLQADSLHQRGRELINEGRIAEGQECTRQAMEIRKRLLGEISEDYITSLNNYALTFSIEENYKKAAELQNEVMSLCGKLQKPHPKLGLFATNMGRFCYLTEKFDDAIKYLIQGLPLMDHDDNYYISLMCLGSAYSQLGEKNRLLQFGNRNCHKLKSSVYYMSDYSLIWLLFMMN